MLGCKERLLTWVCCGRPGTGVHMIGPGYWVHVYRCGTATTGMNAMTSSKGPGPVTRSTGAIWCWRRYWAWVCWGWLGTELGLMSWSMGLTWVLSPQGQAWYRGSLGRASCWGQEQNLVLTLLSFPHRKGVFLSMRLHGLGGMTWVMWDCSLFPLQCFFSYVYAPLSCCNLSPGILSSCKGVFECGGKCWKLLFHYFADIVAMIQGFNRANVPYCW